MPRTAAAQLRVELKTPVRVSCTAALPLFGVSIDSGVLRTLDSHHWSGVAGAIASHTWGTEYPGGTSTGESPGVAPCRPRERTQLRWTAEGSHAAVGVMGSGWRSVGPVSGERGIAGNGRCTPGDRAGRPGSGDTQ